MFCPRCGTQNELKQGYCRQCGQPLSGVSLAVEGNADRSLEKLTASQKWINGGTATLVSFTLIGLVMTTAGFALNEPALSNIAVINLLLGSTIGLPLVFVGRMSLKRGVRLLREPGTESSHSILDRSQPDSLLNTGLESDLPRLPIPGSGAEHPSITEHTTLDLRESERVRRQQN